MICSMTGFGRADHSSNGVELTIEIRTVNHRFLEVFVHLPEETPRMIEKVIRDEVADSLDRGRVDVHADLNIFAADGQCVRIDRNLVQQYHSSLKELASSHDLEVAASIFDLVQLPGVVQIQKRELVASQLQEAFAAATRGALQQVMQARQEEGGRLSEALRQLSYDFEQSLTCLQSRAPDIERKRYRQLVEKVEALLAEEDLTAGHLDVSGEVAMAVQKTSVTEELDRLDSHLKRLRRLLDEGGVVGRQLQFVAQEMWRETNTVSAKVADANLSEVAIKMKNILEDVREQVRNIE